MIVAFDPYSGTIGRFSRDEIISMVAEAGYEGINLPISPGFMDAEDPGDVEEVKKRLGDAGLAVPSVGIGKHTLTTPGLEQETQDWYRVGLAVAVTMDCGILAAWPNQPADVSKQEALTTMSRNLEVILPLAEEAGCAITLEFEKGCPLDNYREAVEYIQTTDKRIAATADTYHMFNDNANMYEGVVSLGDMLVDAHISGSHRGEPGSEEDQVDYEGFMRGIKQIGYDGALVLQYQLDDPGSMGRACEFTKGLRESIA